MFAAGRPVNQPVVPPLKRIEAHYRKFLNARWAGLIVRSVVVTTASFIVVPFLLMSSDYTVLSLLATVFLVGPLVYFLAVHPVLMVRRACVIAPPKLPAGTSARTVLAGSFAYPTLPLYAAYWAFGVVFALAYAFSLNARNAAAELTWLNPTPRHKWHGNERLWFLVLGSTGFALFLAARDVFTAAFLPQWPKSRSRFHDAVRRSLIACFVGWGPGTFWADMSHAATFTLAYSFIYFTFRRWAWRTAITYLPFLRPFVINFAKSRTNITWSLGWHLLVVELTALLALKPALAVMNDYLTQPLHFASFTSRSPISPDRYLLAALDSTNAFYIDHTVLELQRVAHSPERRAALFADTSKPALIHELWKALLVQLGNAHVTLVNRGAQPTPKKALDSAPIEPNAQSIPLKAGNIFLPAPPKTLLQKVAGKVLAGPPEPTPAPVLAIAEGVERAEHRVMKRAEAPAHAAEQWAAGAPIVGAALSTFKLVRGGFATWAGEEWTRRNVLEAIPEPDRLARLVDILATLSVASADEDTYGYVQAVLPSTLEAFVRLRAAALALRAELLKQAGTVAPGADADVHDQIRAVVDILEGGVHRIVERFGRTLQAFRFPNEIALVLTDISKTAA